MKRVPIGVDLHPGFTSGRWLMFWEEAEESEDKLGRISADLSRGDGMSNR